MNLLVYIVSINEYLNNVLYEDENATTGDPAEMSDKEFVREARRQENVRTLVDFQNEFNDGEIAPGDCFIRILDSNIENENHIDNVLPETDDKHYRVIWEIDEYAETPIEAIRKAISRFPHENNPDTMATVFEVEQRHKGQVIKKLEIDLLENEGQDRESYTDEQDRKNYTN